MIRAVFGGTFDPVHQGHKALVETILDRGLADTVHVVPAWLSPHKSAAAAMPAHRLAMARLAFAGLDDVLVEASEVEAARPVFTVETLRALQRRHPQDEFRLTVGADQLRAFSAWREPSAILDLAALLVFARDGVGLEELCAAAGVPFGRCLLVEDFDEPVSASRIRATLADGGDARLWLDPAVADYIERHALYRG